MTHARKKDRRTRHLCLTLQHQEGGAVSKAVAELAGATLSNNKYYYYCTCTHIHTMRACRDVACDVQVQRIMLASHLAATTVK